jgi:hypothetical protein
MSKPDSGIDGIDENQLDPTAQGKKPKLGMEKRYYNRFNHVKAAKILQKEGNLLQAVKKYHEYLKVIGDLHEVDPYKLKPNFFSKERDLAEMFLISQVYWELAKIYDLTPKLQPQFTNCLNQFLLFTNNQPFQIVNSEICRRHIKKGRLSNIKAYQEAYNTIYIANKSCYIATECYGANHNVTNSIRKLKPYLAKFRGGMFFTKKYYQLSPRAVYYSRKHPVFFTPIKNLFIKPALYLLSKAVEILKM